MTNRKDVPGVAWRTSSYSGGGNECVEAGPLPGGDAIALRDSKNRAKGVHIISNSAWAAFVQALKHGRV